MPCFGKTYCYISKTIHSVRVFRRFLLRSLDILNMGVVRNKHGKLWCPLDFRSLQKGGFKISLATTKKLCLLFWLIKSSQCQKLICPVWLWSQYFLIGSQPSLLFLRTITAEIHARSLAKFYGQYGDRHMNLKFVRRISERERAIRLFVIAN